MVSVPPLTIKNDFHLCIILAECASGEIPEKGRWRSNIKTNVVNQEAPGTKHI